MRVFTASLATETNTFSPIPTDRTSFLQAFYATPGEHPLSPTLCSSVMVVLRKLARPDLEVIEGTACWAEPGGLVQQHCYESLRDEILGQLKAALPVDGVILGLHGAMVAQGYDDCEGDLLSRVRELVGPKVIVAAELDPHSHLTPLRMTSADILACFLEFPHTDFYERAEHVVALSLKAIRGEITPTMASFDCRMIAVLPTSREPMRSYVDRIKRLQGHDGIISISVIHGFMAGDVPEMGSRILVISDDDPEQAEALAERLGQELFEMRDQTMMAMKNVEKGVAAAIAAHAAQPDKPAVIADVWDNPGGGVAGDATAILRELLDKRVANVGVATIWDPVAVTFCHAAGEGAVLRLRFGGKTGPAGGEPIDAEVIIKKTVQEAWQSFGQSQVPLGRSAVIQLVGTKIEIILNSNRTQTFEPDVFSNLGIDHLCKDILLVKSTNHFYAGFQPIAADIIYIAGPSAYPSDPRVTEYRKLSRPVWPRVRDPFGQDCL